MPGPSASRPQERRRGRAASLGGRQRAAVVLHSLQCCPSDVGSLPSAWFLRVSGGSTSSLRLGSCRAARTRWGEQAAAGARDASPSLGCSLSAPARRAGPRPAGLPVLRGPEPRVLLQDPASTPAGRGAARSEVRPGRAARRLLAPARGGAEGSWLCGGAAGWRTRGWRGGREQDLGKRPGRLGCGGGVKSAGFRRCWRAQGASVPGRRRWGCEAQLGGGGTPQVFPVGFPVSSHRALSLLSMESGDRFVGWLRHALGSRFPWVGVAGEVSGSSSATSPLQGWGSGLCLVPESTAAGPFQQALGLRALLAPGGFAISPLPGSAALPAAPCVPVPVEQAQGFPRIAGNRGTSGLPACQDCPRGMIRDGCFLLLLSAQPRPCQAAGSDGGGTGQQCLKEPSGPGDGPVRTWPQPSRADDRVVGCPQRPPSPRSPPVSLQVTVPKMSLWNIVSHMPPEEFSSLFAEFPRSLRCLLADWLENQPW